MKIRGNRLIWVQLRDIKAHVVGVGTDQGLGTDQGHTYILSIDQIANCFMPLCLIR